MTSTPVPVADPSLDDLETLIAEGRLYVALCPIKPVSATNGEIYAREMLLRAPGKTTRKLLYDMERAGKMSDLARALVAQAYALAGQNRQNYHFNLRPEDLTLHLVDVITSLEHKAKKSRQVGIEITEQSTISLEQWELLQKLHQQGIPIWLDDVDVLLPDRLLEYLQRDLPITGVKISHKLIHNAFGPQGPKNPAAYSQLQSLAKRCDERSWEIIAEGANRMTDWLHLSRLGIHYYQLRHEDGSERI